TDTYKFDATGKVMGTAPKEILDLANSKQVQPFAVVSNYGKTDWDTSLAHKILSNTEIRKKFISNLLSLLRANHYKGVNIDLKHYHQRIEFYLVDLFKLYQRNYPQKDI
ncbi:hypothetical protein, partial [Pseudomonas sp. FW305-BF6]|uniref:hypothetical protein n=1 Tax=Pseudomonas sp. FW305-BF6 TaxID=2070673 RepID=UPI001C46B353